MFDQEPKSPYVLSTEQIQELEARLLSVPDDFSARKILLREYGRQRFRSAGARADHQRHVFWIIEHHPESKLAGSPSMRINGNQEALKQAMAMWIEQVDAHPENASVLGHSAKFFLYISVEGGARAEAWLQKAQVLEPDNPEWPASLGTICDFRRRRSEQEQRKRHAQEGLRHFERAYELTIEEERRILLLDDMARDAIEAEEYGKAKDYATRLIAGASVCAEGIHVWFPGNAIHWGHIVLGRLALHDGDIEAAKTHLLAAGNTPGSPQLNSYGPDVDLAKQMLETGQSETVTTYLKSCALFWKDGQEELSSWVSAIRQNRDPDFSSHLQRG